MNDVVVDWRLLHNGDEFSRQALNKLFPDWAEVAKFQKMGSRGVVYAWCTQDDKWGYQMVDEVHGEIG